MKNIFENFDSFNKITEIASTIQIQPTTYGFEKASPEMYIQMSRCFEYSIHYVISGSGYICYQGHKTVKVKAGEIFFLTPYNGTITYYSDKQNPWEYCWINFIGNINELLKKLNLNCDNPTVKPVFQSEIRKAYYNALINAEQYANFSGFILLGSIYNILFQLLKNTKRSILPKKYLSYIELAQKIVEENYADPTLSLESVAKKCALNSAYLSRIFKKNMGINFKAYLMDVRIRKATQLISQGLYSVKELSQAVGFSSQYYFSNQFLKLHKIRPSTYIEQYKQVLKNKNSASNADFTTKSPL